MFDDIFEKALEYLDANDDLELVEIIASSATGTPRKKGALMFVDKDGKSFGTVGGGKVEYMVTLYTKELLTNKESAEKTYNLSQEGTDSIGMVCGGESHLRFTYLTNDEKSRKIIEALKEKNKNKNIVFIFGAGHVSMELAKILDYVDFDVVVWDDRDDFANSNRFPTAKRTICKPFENILDEINITDNDLIVIMTRGHVCDYLVEKQVLDSKAFYIGAIGSTNKNKTIREKLIEDGFKEERVKNVCAPIGFDIGAETPSEIAIAIASELILFRSRLENRNKVMNNNKFVSLYKERGIEL